MNNARSLPYQKIVVTGGAGFVGSHLAILFKQTHSSLKVVALDNLYRRGSELALDRLKKEGVEFVHGDIRCKEDLQSIGAFDLLIECSAEPSVRAGYGEDPTYLLNTNLVGTLHCLEAVRKNKADLIFLSTSRVYSIAKLQSLPLFAEKSRFVLRGASDGWSERGITTQFSTQGSRSLYGSTKLASELILQEYEAMYDLRILINRCGVIAGSWQMGKVDQGFVTLWLARHLFKKPLQYTGFGGHGHQVRDVLHVEDLFELLLLQLSQMAKHRGKTYNVGGGLANSTSLRELTQWCADAFGEIPIHSDPKTHPADIPYYITDNTEVMHAADWHPKRSLSTTFNETKNWLISHRPILERIMV